MFLIPLISLLIIVSTLLSTTDAAFNPDARDNLSIYWGKSEYYCWQGVCDQRSANNWPRIGQNSFNGPHSQERLSHYCQVNDKVSIIPIAFLTALAHPALNVASATDSCTAAADNAGLFICPQIEEDIKECQSKYGKTILLSLGGATYTEGGFQTPQAAQDAAQNIWAMFGPQQTNSNKAVRPFGSAIIDGFDFDLESPDPRNMEPFAAELRRLMDQATDKKRYLSAAPQCPYPDQADTSFIDGQVMFDLVQVQYYNNPCGVAHASENWNFAQWDDWAKKISRNPNVKVLVGIPGSANAASSDSYVSGAALSEAIKTSQSYSSFGGVMIWDMSQVYNNPGFLEAVVDAMGGTGPPPSTSTSATSPSNSRPSLIGLSGTSTGTAGGLHTGSAGPGGTTTSSPSSDVKPNTGNCAGSWNVTSTSRFMLPQSSGPPRTAGLNQWEQCGGREYMGPTQCKAPYRCKFIGEWWSHCE